MTEIATVKTVAARPRRMARTPSQDRQGVAEQSSNSAQTSEPKSKSKQEQVIDLLRREGGALLSDLVEATGWLPHTARAALTGIKKKGHKIIGTKVEKVTRYSIVGE